MRRLLLVPLAALALASPASAAGIAGPECDSPSRPHVHVGVNCYADGPGWCGFYAAVLLVEMCPVGKIELGP
ncbi:MAG TPA: hypothetical protein VNQ77_03845 [Frankiaceae bacterium]|nr:hypothetical protein [Frankiaceae bacterium]